MRGMWFESYERLCNELEREPTEAEIESAFRGDLERLYDAADDARKRERGE